MSKKRLLAVLLAVAAACVGAGVVLHQSDTPAPAATPPQPVRVPVVATKVVSGNVPIYLRGVGTVIAYNNVIIRSQITGQLVKISFQQGQTVHQATLLAEIDPRPYQAQLDQTIANRDRDQAQLVNAQANLDRYTQLGTKGFATPQLIETQKAQLGRAAGRDQIRRSADRRGPRQSELHATHCPDRRRYRHSPDRYRQHHSSD